MGGQTQTLSDILINARVPAGQRDRLPLLLVGNQIGWIGLGQGGRVADALAVRSADQRIMIAFWKQE